MPSFPENLHTDFFEKFSELSELYEEVKNILFS